MWHLHREPRAGSSRAAGGAGEPRQAAGRGWRTLPPRTSMAKGHRDRLPCPAQCTAWNATGRSPGCMRACRGARRGKCVMAGPARGSAEASNKDCLADPQSGGCRWVATQGQGPGQHVVEVWAASSSACLVDQTDGRDTKSERRHHLPGRLRTTAGGSPGHSGRIPGFPRPPVGDEASRRAPRPSHWAKPGILGEAGRATGQSPGFSGRPPRAIGQSPGFSGRLAEPLGKARGSPGGRPEAGRATQPEPLGKAQVARGARPPGNPRDAHLRSRSGKCGLC